MRWKATLGTDGEMNGPPTRISDFCWDLPIDQTLKRWFRDCPRVLADVLAFQERMHRRAMEGPVPTDPEVITLVDFYDGHIYRDHAATGDEARRARPTHYHPELVWVHPEDFTIALRSNCGQLLTVPLVPDPTSHPPQLIPLLPWLPSRVVLTLIKYYDDVEPANSLGHARVIHKMGCFYYVLVDLSQGSRQQLQFITPFTMANAKDVTRYGPKVLVGDPTSPDYNKCTCAAATLRRMSDTSVEPVTWNLPMFGTTLPVRIEVYVGAVAGDHPAQAVLGYGMRSVSARMFDRRTMLDQNDPSWTEPNACLVEEAHSEWKNSVWTNPDLPHRWQLRSQALLAEHRAKYSTILAEEGDPAAAVRAFPHQH